MRIIDLSMVTSTDPSPLMNVKLTHLSHIEGALEDQSTSASIRKTGRTQA